MSTKLHETIELTNIVVQDKHIPILSRMHDLHILVRCILFKHKSIKIIFHPHIGSIWKIPFKSCTAFDFWKPINMKKLHKSFVVNYYNLLY